MMKRPVFQSVRPSIQIISKLLHEFWLNLTLESTLKYVPRIPFWFDQYNNNFTWSSHKVLSIFSNLTHRTNKSTHVVKKLIVLTKVRTSFRCVLFNFTNLCGYDTNVVNRRVKSIFLFHILKNVMSSIEASKYDEL